MKNLDAILNKINRETNINELENIIAELSIIRKVLIKKKQELVILNMLNKLEI
ncbi:hypothetical protein ACFHWD_03695 [Clostridium sp. MT-14]|uniref:hypothetical protein n=1 Tax=Clostridium sp. MT-14 TaxID=3348360 RepID=UPI0035F34392